MESEVIGGLAVGQLPVAQLLPFPWQHMLPAELEQYPNPSLLAEADIDDDVESAMQSRS